MDWKIDHSSLILLVVHNVASPYFALALTFANLMSMAQLGHQDCLFAFGVIYTSCPSYKINVEI